MALLTLGWAIQVFAGIAVDIAGNRAPGRVTWMRFLALQGSIAYRMRFLVPTLQYAGERRSQPSLNTVPTRRRDHLLVSFVPLLVPCSDTLSPILSVRLRRVWPHSNPVAAPVEAFNRLVQEAVVPLAVSIAEAV